MTIPQRPTLLGLMLLIAYLAVGLAAIRADTDLWTGIVLGLTAFLLAAATLVAIDRRGAWAGFAVFGWASFLFFNPNASPTDNAPVSMQCAYGAVRFFTRANVPPYSLRSGLCLASVGLGLLGAAIGGRIARADEANPNAERNPTDAP